MVNQKRLPQVWKPCMSRLRKEHGEKVDMGKDELVLSVELYPSLRQWFETNNSVRFIPMKRHWATSKFLGKNGQCLLTVPSDEKEG